MQGDVVGVRRVRDGWGVDPGEKEPPHGSPHTSERRQRTRTWKGTSPLHALGRGSIDPASTMHKQKRACVPWDGMELMLLETWSDVLHRRGQMLLRVLAEKSRAPNAHEERKKVPVVYRSPLNGTQDPCLSACEPMLAS